MFITKVYGIRVEVRRLNEQVKRNIERFPGNFMFQLNAEEAEASRSQNATLNLKSQIATSSWGGKRKLPFAFTEHGVVTIEKRS